MDREENWPCYETSKATNNTDDFQVSEEEKGINGRVVDNVYIWNFVERLDPIEPARWQLRSPFMNFEAAEEAPG
jgi:hypothetical protein